MSAKIVYVVYGSRSEIGQLIAFLVSGEMCFHYSGEYLYFSYDPTELIKEAGMDLLVYQSFAEYQGCLKGFIKFVQKYTTFKHSLNLCTSLQIGN